MRDHGSGWAPAALTASACASVHPGYYRSWRWLLRDWDALAVQPENSV